MTLFQALVMGLLQGATEFLPVSSSGHLVLLPWFLGWPALDLTFGVLLHWGTAFAVIAYFWRDWLALAQGAWQAVRSRSLADPRARLAALVVLGSVPAALVGGLLESFFEQMFARPVAAAGFLLVTAGVLATAEGWVARHPAAGDCHTMPWADALLAGLAQAAAIFPGVSRSGMTIAAGMWRGLGREQAARFSFLLATPIIIGAGLLQLVDIAWSGDLAAQAPLLLTGFFAALGSGLAGIHFLLRYLQQRSLYPFAIYCALLGVGGLVFGLVSG